MLGGLMTFLITLIGLIGYIADETTRRSKEIAIRKVNGATIRDILMIISKDVLYMAVPAVIFGVVGSYIMGEDWLQQFSEKIPEHVYFYRQRTGDLVAGIGNSCTAYLEDCKR